MNPKKWPFHAMDEIEAVNQVLHSGRTNYWTGTACKTFEKEFAVFMGSAYAIALMNGTIALEAALYALEIGPGDEVITSSRTFIASASCIVMRGAKPVMADVDPDSQNITPATIEPCITARTKAIIVVHLAGWPADMQGILKLAQKYNLKVIEDCAQAHGAEINNQKVGTFGDIAAFSFCQDKIITTGGEGGMILTQDKHLWEKIWSMKDHGKNYKKIKQKTNSQFRWLHDSFGTNWRMTEMQSAIGRVQLKKLPEWLNIRKKNANHLTENFKSIPALRIPLPPTSIRHAYYKYYVFLTPEKLRPSWDRNKIIEALTAENIPCFSGSCSEIYQENAFSDDLKPAQRRPIAKQLGETSLMFLVDPTFTEDTLQKIADVAKPILQKATLC